MISAVLFILFARSRARAAAIPLVPSYCTQFALFLTTFIEWAQAPRFLETARFFVDQMQDVCFTFLLIS